MTPPIGPIAPVVDIELLSNLKYNHKIKVPSEIRVGSIRSFLFRSQRSHIIHGEQVAFTRWPPGEESPKSAVHTVVLFLTTEMQSVCTSTS
jgi:hypothetical protein